MWPTLFRWGDFELTTFGLMMFLAFIAAGSVVSRQFRRYGIREEIASAMLLAAAFGGIIGAKLYYGILYGDLSLVFSRAGLVFYGGLIGGWLACSIVVWMNRLPYFLTADAAAPAMALGYGLGRIGCFLVGDDYGRPTNAWYGIAFPNGAPPTTAASLRDFGVAVDPSIPDWQVLTVHPTQLYESAAGFAIFALLFTLSRRPHRLGLLSGLFLLLLGLERFFVEFVRAKDDRFFGPFTIAQVISVILILAGAWFSWSSRRRSLNPEVTR